MTLENWFVHTWLGSSFQPINMQLPIQLLRIKHKSNLLIPGGFDQHWMLHSYGAWWHSAGDARSTGWIKKNVNIVFLYSSLNKTLVLFYWHRLRKWGASGQPVRAEGAGITSTPVVNNIAFAWAPQHAHHCLLESLRRKLEGIITADNHWKKTKKTSQFINESCRTHVFSKHNFTFLFNWL